MTTINDITDLIRILRTNPDWAEAARSVLRTQELQKLPEEFAALTKAFREQTETVNRRLEMLQSGQDRLDQGQAQLQTGADGLETAFNAIKKDLSTIGYYFYRGNAAKFASRVARKRFQLKEITTAHHANQDGDSRLTRLLDEAVDNPALEFTEDQASLVERSDAVIVGKAPDGTDVYLLAEFSMTIDKDDVDRARERAELLSRATGARTLAVVVGESIRDEAAAHAEGLGVTFAEFIRKRQQSQDSE